MIEFQLLGEVRLHGADEGEVHALLRQPKRLALLAYLVTPLPGTWHRRETLLALFWPDLDTVHARTSLRNAIYVLRQILGDDVLRNRGDEEISVDPAKLETDLEKVSVPSLQTVLREEVGEGWTELACHPGYMTPEFPSIYYDEREVEIQTLTDPRIRKTTDELGITLVGYAEYPDSV